VSGAVSSPDWADPLFTGNNGGALVFVGSNQPDKAVEALVPTGAKQLDEGQLRGHTRISNWRLPVQCR